MAKKIRARKLRRQRRRKKKRTLEAVAAVVLALLAIGGLVLASMEGSIFAIMFCAMWLAGTVFWLFAIFDFRGA